MSKFSLTITPFNKIANLMQLNMPYTFDEVKSELDKEDWEWDRHDLNRNWPCGGRAKLKSPASPLIKEIADYLCSYNAKTTIVNGLYQYISQCEERWRWSLDQMLLNTTLHSEFTRDKPGFLQGVHMDTKVLVATGMIYLTEKDDPLVSTYFHTDNQGNNPVKTPSNFGNGWFHLNDWNSWHSGGNRSNDIRYTILVPLTLNRTLSW
jgi:hypothetical protein